MKVGDQLGPYRVTALLGAGGMGEVYRAHDPRLSRDVAIKVSSERFSDRFVKEAHAIGALNHPNICHLYDVGPNYLVMELVEGDTLAERIRQGALPLEEALAIARQIADALDTAHEKGIVHRDLKPGNVKIKPDGTVKVLDFGLAQTRNTTTLSDDSPTLTTGPTEPGVILGTAAYMPPEQAKGKTVDKRADIWAFGAVLYEMVTGQRLFRGETMTEVLASVLKEDPQWERVPSQVQHLLRRCLDKDPQKRLRHIGDAMELVERTPLVFATATGVPARTSRWLWAVAGVLAVVAAIALWGQWRQQSDLQSVRFEIASTANQTLIAGAFPMVSPNGKWVVFPATGSDGVTRMWLRALDSLEVRPLAGTESANALPPPVFWSPDSRYIVFGSTPGPYAPGQLKKLDIDGGLAQTICDVPAAVPRGTWNREGVIVFAHNAPGKGLLRVSAAGGVATPVTMLDSARREDYHTFPQFLPDGRHFLYFRRFPSNPEYTGVYAGSIDVKPEEQSAKPILLSDRQAAYAPSVNGKQGHLLFLRDTTLFAQIFDPDRLELSGEAVPVTDQVGSFAPANAGIFSVSDTGHLAYHVGAAGSRFQLTWYDPKGVTTGTVGDPGSYQDPNLSPDGTQRIAVSQLDNQKGNSNIWVLDVAHGTNRLTFNSGADRYPVWSPDGKSIIFASNQAGHFDLYQKTADGSGDQVLLLKSEHDKQPTSWSRDGRFLLYTDSDPKNRGDIWVLPLSDRKPISLLQTEFDEGYGSFSADGRWMAYESTESGTNEIYVLPFSPDKPGAAAGGKRMVSKGGGYVPLWRADGKELFYTQDGIRFFAVEVNSDKTFQAGARRQLFSTPALSGAAATADGKRFLFALPEGPNAQTPIIVVLNWQAALKK